MKAFVAGLVATTVLVIATIFVLDTTQISMVEKTGTRATHVKTDVNK